MCQLILKVDDPELSDSEVVEVLEDREHPGKMIVPWPEWDGQPVRGWRIIHLRGVPAARWNRMRDVELDTEGKFVRIRTERLALTSIQRSALEGERKVEFAERDIATEEVPVRASPERRVR